MENAEVNWLESLGFGILVGKISFGVLQNIDLHNS